MADTKAGPNMAKVKMGAAKVKAKAKTAAATEISGGTSPDADRYKVEDGLRTLTRAEEIRSDRDLMGKIADHAADQAEMAQRAAGLAKRGVISEKQADKLAAKAQE